MLTIGEAAREIRSKIEELAALCRTLPIVLAEKVISDIRADMPGSNSPDHEAS